MTQETKEGGSNASEIYDAHHSAGVVRSHSYGHGGGYAKLADYTAEPSPSDADSAENKKEPPSV